MISDIQIDPLFSSSKFIWAADHGAARNQYVSFFREVTLGEDLELTIHLFADTRYRLFVNEQFVGYGPGKFVTQFAEFDTFGLAPQLSRGANLIRVEVNFYGTASFQSMPDGQPGFIAAGGLADGSISLATPGDWRARVHAAWSAEAVAFSFAQNPAEICDTHVLLDEIDSGADREVRVLEPYETPWDTLRARSVPYPTYQAVEPAELASAGPSAFDRDVYAVASHHIDFLRFRYARGRGKRSMSRQFVSWIYSPEDQVVVVDSHWSKMALNGQILELDLATPLGNHGTYTFDLKQGWNGLSGAFGIVIEYDTFLLGWQKSAGLTMKALPNFEETAPWAWSPLMYELSIIPLPEAEKYEIPLGWVREDQDLYATAPARLMAWERMEDSKVIRDLPYHRFQEATTIRAKTGIWNFDFKEQFYAIPEIEVEAPAGSILEIGYDDWPHPDGGVHLYNSNPMVHSVDRFVLRGGRQTITLGNPRGGIWVEVVIRAAGTADLSLHSIRMLSRQVLLNEARVAQFSSGDADFDWAWDKSLHTLEAGTDDAYSDCPWRERGTYVGDSLVNLHLHEQVSADFSLARRTFQMFGEGQHVDGEMKGKLPSVIPAWLRDDHEDYTLIWVIGLRDYWMYTGDLSLVEEMWDRVLRLWESPAWLMNSKGLLDLSAERLSRCSIDWGKDGKQKQGKSHLTVNMFRLEALKATVQMAELLEKHDLARFFSDQVKATSEALLRVLWNEELGRFNQAEDDASLPIHGNVLALAFGLGPSGRILGFLEPYLRSNFERGIRDEKPYLELYFQSYLYPALAKMGRGDLVELMIRQHYGFLRSLGKPTLNECFGRAYRGVGSCSHSWSGAAGIYIHRFIIGLRLVEAGRPNHLILDPKTTTIDSISAVLPRQDGQIRIQWTRTAEGIIEAKVEKPSSVTIEFADGVVLARPC